MNLATELLVIGVVVPGTIAAAAAWAAQRLSAAPWVQLYALPAAVAVAYAVSYALLPEWAALQPERHWQWLPYLAPAAAVIGPACVTPGRPAWLRSLVFTALAVGAAYVLVPDWPDLQPARRVSVALIAVYLSSLMLAGESIASRLSALWLLGLLAISSIVLTVVLAIDVFRYGQLAAMAAAALAGCLLMMAISRGSARLDVRGLVPIYALLVGGAAYVGCVEPQPPLWWLLLIPAIPLAIGALVLHFTPYRASADSGR
jgi:hypothetical protein